MANEDHWNTDNEIAYINLLISGAYKENPQLTSEERLENYIKSAKRRVMWNTFGAVKGGEVIMYAEEQLKRLRGE